MTLLKVFWLSLIPCVALSQTTGYETTQDYNIYFENNGETTADYNIYYGNRQEDLDHPFVLKSNGRRTAEGKYDILLFEETSPTQTDDGRDLFDGDILLTDAQWRDLALRKGLASEQKRWPDGGDGFPRVPYRFADAEVDQSAVRNGIAHWESHTCIKFEETSDTNQPHLRFVKDSGCWSYVGYLSSYTSGQDISIGKSCISLGVVAHEIGHAIGFYHEQSRPDRDSYIHINEENIKQGYGSNFKMASDSRVDSKDVPYDFTSDMHYGGKKFSNNGKMTIATLDPRDQELIGKRTGLSHRDKLLANLMYGCIDKWLQNCGQESDHCQNGGYTISNCTCVCPPGTSGSQCESVVADYYADMRDDCNEMITSPGTVSSPNYPSNYPSGLKCAKWIVAPICKAPKVTFSDFRLTSCINSYDQLEIRTSNRYSGDFYCGTDISTKSSFTSTTNELILMFYTKTDYASGWSADITFEDIKHCNPETQTTTTQAPSTTRQPIVAQPSSPGTPDCTLEYTSTGANWLSPNFGSGNYLDNASCGLNGFTVTPMKGIYKFSTFTLQPAVTDCTDYVSFQIPFNRTKKYCGEMLGSHISPILNMDINFKTDESINDIGFNISMSWKETFCHEIIELPNDDSTVGYIKSPRYPSRYPKNAVCEWWLVAPEGRRIQLDFTTISFLSSKCENSYIVVDKAGTTKYFPETSELLCSTNTSATVTSEAHFMNVAFAGGTKRSTGFEARYTLV